LRLKDRCGRTGPRRSAHPFIRVSEAKVQNPGAKRAAGTRECVSVGVYVLIDAVSAALRAARPHPEARAGRRCAAKSRARARISKDEDGHRAPSSFETPRRSALNICVRGGKARLLSMRAAEAGAFWRNEPNRRRYQPAAVGNDRRLAFHCFRIVIYNGLFNPNVSDRTQPTSATPRGSARSKESPYPKDAAPAARPREGVSNASALD
jgi:hypothetical protein